MAIVVSRCPALPAPRPDARPAGVALIRLAEAVGEPPVIRIVIAPDHSPRIAGRSLARLTLATTVAPTMRKQNS